MPLINKSKLVYPELSYKITGILYKAHNDHGRFKNEKQYCDAVEELLKRERIPYSREVVLPLSFKGERPGRNIADFIIENKIIIEVKAKSIISKADYYQLKRYLIGAGLDLGILVNFRRHFLAPKRVLVQKHLEHSDKIRGLGLLNKKGFTLIEFLISLGITVIIGSIGLLVIQNIRVQKNLEFEADKLIQTLREAQQNSISELELSYWSVYADAPNGSSDSYKIFYATSVGGSASTTHRSVILPSAIEFTSPAQGSSSTVNFLKISGVPQNTATFTLRITAGGAEINVRVLENGNITR